MVPWGLLATNPELVVLIPFVWFLWQFYAPPLIDKLVGYKPDSPEHLYETRVTKALHSIFSQVDRMDSRVDDIGNDVEKVAETQEDLVNITLAQTRHMNGYDGDIDLQEVEQTLTEERENRPADFLKDNSPERYADGGPTAEEDDET